ncbi:MAG TPA: hypothetical protein VFN08_03945 [Gemmatimonadales bacterium]|nr:hypothetical protein [Gemmatimonadales bacterium]
MFAVAMFFQFRSRTYSTWLCWLGTGFVILGLVSTRPWATRTAVRAMGGTCA